MFSMLSFMYNSEEEKQNTDIRDTTIQEHTEGPELQGSVNTISQPDEVPFQYSIKSTSKKRFTHPEQYEAQLNWQPPNTQPSGYNDLYSSSNLRSYGYPHMAHSSPNLKLHTHNKKLQSFLKKRRIVHVQREDPTSIKNLFNNDISEFM